MVDFINVFDGDAKTLCLFGRAIGGRDADDVQAFIFNAFAQRVNHVANSRASPQANDHAVFDIFNGSPANKRF